MTVEDVTIAALSTTFLRARLTTTDRSRPVPSAQCLTLVKSNWQALLDQTRLSRPCPHPSWQLQASDLLSLIKNLKGCNPRLITGNLPRLTSRPGLPNPALSHASCAEPSRTQPKSQFLRIYKNNMLTYFSTTNLPTCKLKPAPDQTSNSTGLIRVHHSPLAHPANPSCPQTAALLCL